MPEKTITDQTGFSFTLKCLPRRIVSLVPSQTEFLHSIGLENETQGITKFCIHPDHWFLNKKHVGGTKNFDFAAIENIQPDLILGNKEENYREGIEKLREKFPVWISDIINLDDALDMMTAIGSITGKSLAAETITNRIRHCFNELKPSRKARVLYLIWRKPWMAAGEGTFIDDMLTRNGFENVVQANRYPSLEDETIASLQPDYVFLSSEPFPFRDIHKEEISRLSPRSKPILVDGEMFSWYGSRLLLACDYFKGLRL